MDRTKFFNIATVGGINELDYLDHPLSSFEIVHTPVYYKTDEHDVGRPDLISFELYRTVKYWWIICLVNNIVNPFTDIVVGSILLIPHLADIYDFYKKFKVR